MNKSIKTTLFSLLMAFNVALLGITYKDAITKVNKEVTKSDANRKAQAELQALAISPKESTLRSDGTIYIHDSKVNAIIAKHSSSETKTKDETVKSSSSSSSSSSLSWISSETKQKKEKCDFGDCWPLPKGLQNKEIYYLAITNQLGSSCGYHAVANAWAIQNLITANTVITPAAIDKEKGSMGSSSEICNETLINQATELKIKNLYVMAVAKNKKIYEVQHTSNSNSLETCFKYLKENKQKSAFFVFNVPGHWVLIAVIKENSKANIMLLDSANTPLTANDLRYDCLQYIYNQVTPKSSIKKPDTSSDEALAQALQEATPKSSTKKTETSSDEALARALQESLRSK